MSLATTINHSALISLTKWSKVDDECLVVEWSDNEGVIQCWDVPVIYFSRDIPLAHLHYQRVVHKNLVTSLLFVFGSGRRKQEIQVTFICLSGSQFAFFHSTSRFLFFLYLWILSVHGILNLWTVERILKVRKKSGNRERCRKLSLWNCF